MERLRRVSDLWAWLPVFRAVAETQHLRAAAERLHISPSALSRTIRLLEDEIGMPLFRRVGRSIELNESGTVLLDSVRDAMRLVHDALLRIEARVLEGEVRIWGPGTLTHAFLIPALERLQGEYPKLVPHLHTVPHDDLDEMLLRGELDIALTTHPIAHRSLVSRHLGTQTIGVYCGRGHPLFGRETVTLEELESYPFVTPPPDRRGITSEGWPPERRRWIGATATSLHVGLDICRRGGYLSVFPDLVVRSCAQAEDFHRLPIEIVPPIPFFLTYRRTVTATGKDEPGRSEAVVAVIVEVVREQLATPAPTAPNGVRVAQ